MQFPEIIFLLSQYATPSEPIYLVGGAVRDSLLGKSSEDFDFVCASNPRNIARAFADEIGGAFFVLDEKRNTFRVLFAQKTNDQMIFDFAQMRGENIVQDLFERDFTINSVAVDLASHEVIIDPTKGGKDLQQKFLHPVKATSIQADPIRALRAVRYAVDLGLKIEPGTTDLLRQGAKGLDRISSERKRDELFKILEGEHSATALRLLERLSIFSEMNLKTGVDFDQICRKVQVLHEMVAMLSGRSKVDKSASFYRTSMLLRFGRFTEKFEQHFYQQNYSGRDRQSLVKLYLIIGRENKQTINQLALSSDELATINLLAQNENSARQLIDNQYDLDFRSIYRFFKASGDAGIDLAFLALIEYASLPIIEFSQERWLRLLERSESLIIAWYCQPEVVAPKPLLNGNELMFHFDLAPGKMIGSILEALKEEQAAGNIKTRADALEWVDLRLQRESL